jgi:hypothetical protein
MKTWQRVSFVLVCVAALFALWRLPSSGAVGVLLGLGGAWMGRSVYRSKLTPNPAGQDRDYSLRPVAVAAVKAAGLFVAALFWAVLTGFAIRLGYVSDTWHGAGMLMIPCFILFAVSVLYLINAITKFQLGGRPL